MGPTRNGPLLEHGEAGAPRPHGQASPRTAGPLPADVLLRARRLEELLGDPREPGNPYGFEALAASGTRGLPGLRPLVAVEVLPAARGGRFTDADLLVRALRPLLRRDLAAGYACVSEALLAVGDGGSQAARGAVVGHGAVELTRLLGPAALTAAVGTAVRTAFRAVAGAGPHDRGTGRGPTLAGAFADLLACESLTTAALRSTLLPADTGRALRAAAGCVVPVLAGEILDEVVLALTEGGYEPGDLEMRLCAKVAGDIPYVMEAAGTTAARRTALGRELPFLAAGSEGDGGRAGAVLFRLERHADSGTEEGPADCEAALRALLTGAAAHVADGVAAHPATGLARAARRLLAERRLLDAPGRSAARAGDSAASRALADRHAQLLLACTVLGTHDAAAHHGSRFLADPSWALLALTRLTQRLGIAPAGPVPDARADVAAELAARNIQGVDFDLRATRIPW
ncbi:hypothetical protein [Streptomyces sp. NPDC006739]|uniref:hypothetical protein n=1 Tax=Streptomyces sp. NPDC006739 TaxID=3364763 RepID=UPI0036842D04